MARGVNKVILVGNLGKDPEVRYSANGTAIVNVTLATSETWRDKQTGENQERTEWHTVVFFGKLAEIAGEYLRKGRQVYVEGSLRTRKWQDKNGQDRYSTEVVASDMQMLGSRSEGSTSFDAPPSRPQQRPAKQEPAGQGAASQPAGQSVSDTFDDDIPF